MSIKFNVCLNQGNEALQTGKSITANEVCETADPNQGGNTGGNNEDPNGGND